MTQERFTHTIYIPSKREKERGGIEIDNDYEMDTSAKYPDVYFLIKNGWGLPSPSIFSISFPHSFIPPDEK